jgi:hypothetical protein
MMDDEIQKNPYWMLQFIVRHGGWIAVAAGVLPLLASIAGVACSAPLWWLAAGAVGSAFLFMLMRAFVELVRVMVDMLLPK